MPPLAERPLRVAADASITFAAAQLSRRRLRIILQDEKSFHPFFFNFRFTNCRPRPAARDIGREAARYRRVCPTSGQDLARAGNGDRGRQG